MVAQKVKAALDAADEGLVGMCFYTSREGTQRSLRRHRDAQRFLRFFPVVSVKALRDSV
jgi:hypothetical protein